MTLHFAYGANMNRDAMRMRCPGARALGRAFLRGYRFFILPEGYASVTPSAGGNVHGILWRLTPRDLAALNLFESLDSGLYRRATLPVRFDAKQVNAMIYLGQARGCGKPRPGYMQDVIVAAREWNFSKSYLDRLARFAPGRWQGQAIPNTGAIA